MNSCFVFSFFFFFLLPCIRFCAWSVDIKVNVKANVFIQAFTELNCNTFENPFCTSLLYFHIRFKHKFAAWLHFFACYGLNYMFYEVTLKESHVGYLFSSSLNNFTMPDLFIKIAFCVLNYSVPKINQDAEFVLWRFSKALFINFL